VPLCPLLVALREARASFKQESCPGPGPAQPGAGHSGRQGAQRPGLAGLACGARPTARRESMAAWRRSGARSAAPPPASSAATTAPRLAGPHLQCYPCCCGGVMGGLVGPDGEGGQVGRAGRRRGTWQICVMFIAISRPVP
jgi:hypothetical protein